MKCPHCLENFFESWTDLLENAGGRFPNECRWLLGLPFSPPLAGVLQTPEAIAEAAVQEDVDVVELSILSGDHLSLVPRVLQALREAGAESIPVIVGGVIPLTGVKKLLKLGMAAYFGPGSILQAITGFVASVKRHSAVPGL